MLNNSVSAGCFEIKIKRTTKAAYLISVPLLLLLAPVAVWAVSMFRRLRGGGGTLVRGSPCVAHEPHP